jgi:Tfp pilus assembly protein PilF
MEIIRKIINNKIIKIGTGFVFLLGLFCLVWFLTKPIRITKAEEYLKEATLIGYLKASVLLPRSPAVHLKLGQTYFAQGEYQKAEKEERKALKFCKSCPQFSEIHLGLKKIAILQALKEGDLKKARDILAGGLELNSTDSEIEFCYGVLLTAQGEYEEAIQNSKFKMQNAKLEEQREILLSALSKIPYSLLPNPYSFVLTGAAFLKMDYPNLAILQFEKAAELEPDYRDAYVYLGKAYLQINNLNKAKQALEKAAEIDPINPETFYLLSQTYEKLKKPTESQKALEKAKILGWGK